MINLSLRTRTSNLLAIMLLALAAACLAPAMAGAATYTVTTTTDYAVVANGTCNNGTGATCGLREAITEANANLGADTITLASNATYYLTVTGISDENANARNDLDVTDNVTINGNNSAIRFNGTYPFRLFDVQGVRTLTLNNMQLRDGQTPDPQTGGAILAGGGGSLVLNSVDIFNNSADEGGGISIYGGGSISGSNTTVHNNSAADVYNAGLGGGGIAADAASITGVRAYNNSSISGGGDVYLANGSSYTADFAGISTNASTSTASNLRNTQGGSIYSADSTVNITNAVFAGTSAWQSGGAIRAVNSNVTVDRSRFAGSIAGDGEGGAIYASGTGSLTVTKSAFISNRSGATTTRGSAVSASGVSFNISNSTFYGNIGNSANATSARSVIAATGGATGTIEYDTFVGNDGFTDITASTVNVRRSIVGYNPASQAAPYVPCPGAAAPTDGGYNVLANGSSGTLPTGCNFNAGTTVTSAPFITNTPDAITKAITPDSNSPAINLIPMMNCTVPTDQVGTVRPQSGLCEAGAFEIPAPTNVTPPTLSYTRANVGSVFSVNPNTGTWTGSPTSYTYQWTRSGSDIPSATSASYTATGADIGSTLSVRVTPINSTSGTGTPGTAGPSFVVTAYGPFVVTTNTDYTVVADGICNSGPGGTCGLREAVIEANAAPGADTINFATPSQTITLALSEGSGAHESDNATGDIDVTGTLTINGAASAGTVTTVTRGATVGALISAYSGADLTLNDLRLTNGKPGAGGPGFTGQGGAMHLDGAMLHLNNTNMSGNTGRLGGGAIYAINGSSIIGDGTSTVFNNNVSQSFGSGGGVFLDGSSSTGVVYYNNSGDVAGGDAYIAGGSNLTMNGNGYSTNATAGFYEPARYSLAGGSIYSSNSTYSITNMKFLGTSATEDGGAIYAANSTGTVTSSIFDGTSSTYGNGGAIATVGGTLTVANDTFLANASGGYTDDMFYSSEYAGSAIYSSGTPLTISNSTFYSGVGNASYPSLPRSEISQTGAAVASTIKSSTFVNNAGGLRVTSGSMTVSGSIIGYNPASMAAPKVPCTGGVAPTDGGYNVLANGSSGTTPTGCAFNAGTTVMSSPFITNTPDAAYFLKPIAPNTGHAAINLIPGGSCPTSTDTLGNSRPQGAACDAGALELLVPANTAAPVVTGTAQVGSTLSTTNGSWAPSPTGYTYQWLRGASPIAGATSASYVVAVADIGSTITARVTAANANGSIAASSAPTATVVDIAPTNSSTPSISGGAQEGQTLTCLTGTWTHNPTSYSYIWLRDASIVSGATASTYLLSAPDVGARMSCQVTATNSGGSASQSTLQTAAVLPAAPANSAAPVVSGTAQTGQTLTTSTGTFSGSPSYTYQWKRDGASISGATSSSYVAVVADETHQLTATVTATNAGGSASSTSAPTSAVIVAAPTNSAAPVISGSAQTGQALTTTTGTFSGSPTYTYQWKRDGSPITGATSSTYTAVVADETHQLTVTVTATNAGGSANATSAATSAVIVAAPASSAAPVISGSAQTGQALTTTTGTFSGSPTYTYQWKRDGASISGAASSTYTAVVADETHQLTATVTATNAGGSASSTSSPTSAVIVAAPTNSAAPVISGSAQTGQALTTTTGTFSGSPAYAYQWKRDGSTITGATSSTYTAVVADETHQLTVTVTATNAGGSASSTSAPTSTVTVAAPVGSAAPVISGSAQTGQVLTSTTGTFSGSPAYTYQWKRDGSSISGATSSSYPIISADETHQLSVTVTATNAGGADSATSAPTASVTMAAPTVSTLPAISGAAQTGQTLTATTGTWTGSPTYAYQWKRDAVAISGATSTTYLVIAADETHQLSVTVTATNSGGSTSASSAQTSAVIVAAPANSMPPTISGAAQTGQTLTAAVGAWTGSPTYAYQWKRDAVAISGATGATYSVVSADEGTYLTVTVTATNAGGSTNMTSAATSAVLVAAPAASTAPTISGSAQVGQTLSASTGTFSGSPTYAYQWKRDGAVITGATSSTYVAAAADEATRLSVTVTASNAGGSASSTSTQTALVSMAAPAASAAPVVSGTAQVGQSVSASTGIFSGSPTYAYQWLADGITISGATASTYAIPGAAEGAKLSVRVTATNAGGSASSMSLETAAVLMAAPTAAGSPILSGTAQSGQTLSASAGTWTGTPTSFDYQWQLSGVDIVGATAATYTTSSGDIGSRLRVIVTAHNAGGFAQQTSAQSAVVVQAAPVASSIPGDDPTISGTVQEGNMLTATTGTWSGTSNTYAYQWKRDGSPVSGATSATYALVSADVAARITVTVTATNSGGSASVTSAQTAAVLVASSTNSVAPAITGTARTGSTLTCTPGTWTNSPTFSYQWLIAGSAATGQTATTYTVTAANAGQVIACRVTATNAGGTAQATSASTSAALPDPPASSGSVTITGTAQVGQSLTCNPGTWTPVATGFAYAWKRDGSTISGATASTYTLVSADTGHAISCSVTASNSGGQSSGADGSVQTAAVIVAPPGQSGTGGGVVTVTGTVQVGQTLTCNTGTWSGSPTFAYAWTRDAVAVTGETSATYVVRLADSGHAITCKVTATNAGGSVTTSASSGGGSATPALAPAVVTAPSVNGLLTVGSTLTCDPGTWTSNPAPTFTYAWLRDGVAISGATSATYALLSIDLTHTIACRVSASRLGQNAISTTPNTVAVTAGAAIGGTGGATGTGGVTVIGTHLSCAVAALSGTPTVTYAWLRDGVTISGAAADTYTLGVGDPGHMISCRLTIGAETTTTTPIGPVTDPGPVTPIPTTPVPVPPVPTVPVLTGPQPTLPVDPTNITRIIYSGTTIIQSLYTQLVQSLPADPETGKLAGGSIVPLSRCTIVGTPGNDHITGTSGNDVICGMGGDDTIFGGAGNDVIDAGAGNDTVRGGAGDDVIYGLAGNDRLRGDKGADKIAGGAGKDTVDGGAGNDRISGSSGNDTLLGHLGADILHGGLGNDRLDGGKGKDVLYGGKGKDRLDGGKDKDKDRLIDAAKGNVFVLRIGDVRR